MGWGGQGGGYRGLGWAKGYTVRLPRGWQAGRLHRGGPSEGVEVEGDRFCICSTRVLLPCGHTEHLATMVTGGLQPTRYGYGW